MAWGPGNIGGGVSLNKSIIIVTAPTGSKVTCKKDGKIKSAPEKDGTWTFMGLENGLWTVTATLGSNHTDQTVNVTQFDVYRLALSYVFLVDSIAFAKGMVKGRDYDVFRDDGSVIPAEKYGTEHSWNLEIYTTQALTFKKQGAIDIFAVGAGGNGGGPNYATGGAGGYTQTQLKRIINPGSIDVAIGAAPGGSSSFGEYIAQGGESGGQNKPANGGCGGGGFKGSGGSNGSNGTGTNHGSGQGHTTRAFGEPDGKLYAGGGGGYHGKGGAGGGANSGTSAFPNTGGGGGGEGGAKGGRGGSGIVIIRNAR